MSVSETNKKNKSSVKRRVAISVLIIAFAFGLNITGILPVLGILNEKYQQYGTSAVQLLQTIIYLLLIVGSLMVGWLTTKISKKNITLMGLFIVGCCGVIPFFLESFAVLLLARIVIGFGFGIMGPMNTAIISEFFRRKSVRDIWDCMLSEWESGLWSEICWEECWQALAIDIFILCI